MREKQLRVPPCRFVAMVECGRADRKCDKCGWNPAVTAERKRRFKENVAPPPPPPPHSDISPVHCGDCAYRAEGEMWCMVHKRIVLENGMCLQGSRDNLLGVQMEEE